MLHDQLEPLFAWNSRVLVELSVRFPGSFFAQITFVLYNRFAQRLAQTVIAFNSATAFQRAQECVNSSSEPFMDSPSPPPYLLE